MRQINGLITRKLALISISNNGADTLMTDPLIEFHTDREAARQAQDPMAALCVVANVDAKGQAQLRTVVLRDIAGRLGIFINSTSPKWAALSEEISICTYWPSTQIQYRISGKASEIPQQVVSESWGLRPDMPKRMDWFYTNEMPQSSEIDDRATLIDRIEHAQPDIPSEAPPTAKGLYIDATSIERLDLNQPSGLHERLRWVLDNETWQISTLVP